MQKRYFPLAIAVLVLITVACLCTGTDQLTPTSVPQQEPQQEPSQSTDPDVQSSGIITEVVMARDTEGIELDPVDPTTVFSPDSIIHAVVKIEDAPSNTEFTAAFYVDDVGDAAEPNSLISSNTLMGDGTRNVDFTLTPTTSWPAGTYRVEISINGTLDRVVQYTVQ
jgi:hypothetical protein